VGEGNGLLVLEDIVQVRLGADEGHATDGAGNLHRVLVVHAESRAAGLGGCDERGEKGGREGVEKGVSAECVQDAIGESNAAAVCPQHGCRLTLLGILRLTRVLHLRDIWNEAGKGRGGWMRFRGWGGCRPLESFLECFAVACAMHS
jgi:hypothetical protein